MVCYFFQLSLLTKIRVKSIEKHFSTSTFLNHEYTNTFFLNELKYKYFEKML